MAYQFCDTFDYYNTTMLQAGNVWEVVTNGPIISSSYARFPAIGSYPNNGVFISSTSSIMRKNLKSSQATLIVFISFGASVLPGSREIICSFQDNNTLQCFLALNPDGSLQFCTQVPTFGSIAIGPASAGSLIAPSSTPNHGIEIAVTFSTGSSGSVACWLDGAQVIATTTGLKTALSSNSTANQFSLGIQSGAGYLGSQTQYCDYVRVWDSTGSFQNSPLGTDCRKLTKLPQSAGDLTQWTPNGLSNNWQCVSNNPPNPSDYTSSSTTNLDSYGMGTAGLVLAPNMVVAKSYVEKDDGITRAIEIGVRSGGVNGLGSPYTVGTSYVYVDSCISVDPNTGSPPTAAAADAYQFLKFEST